MNVRPPAARAGPVPTPGGRSPAWPNSANVRGAESAHRSAGEGAVSFGRGDSGFLIANTGGELGRSFTTCPSPGTHRDVTRAPAEDHGDHTVEAAANGTFQATAPT
ncbi:hypothetical protein [Streptomyces litchfieldiae]|uniref:Uncharacterized protein n=1 Tax=Streptomyces litchfieldiae TaxID=3075543 RepID=A0ABU2MZJ2_9ACTN|nr:hypothetical protein [Streptomyces sp. DSM 44938]MDT0347077.1 hypothetical protein [Streptomyces sp. DSM 44938]